MIEKHPQGFSTADLYSRVYHEQHKARKPLLFNQSKLDFGKIWLRPCQQKATSSTNAADAADVADSKFTLDVRFHLTKSVTIMDLNKVAKALQWIPFVQKVDMRSMHSPEDDLYEVIRKIHAANLLRPHLIRIRRALDAKKQQQLRRTDTSPPSSPIENSTSERFLEQKPRDVELFNWSDTKVVTPHHGRLSPKDCLDLKVTPVKPDGSIVPRVIDAFLAQRALDGILFFTLGVVAPVVLRCAVRGCASAFAAS
jgi:hypothetical protein